MRLMLNFATKDKYSDVQPVVYIPVGRNADTVSETVAVTHPPHTHSLHTHSLNSSWTSLAVATTIQALQPQMHTLHGPLSFGSGKGTLHGLFYFCSCKCTLCMAHFAFAAARAHFAGTASLLQPQMHTLQGPFTFQLQMHTFLRLQLHALQTLLHFCSCKCTLCRDRFTLQLQKGGVLQLLIHTLQGPLHFCSC